MGVRSEGGETPTMALRGTARSGEDVTRQLASPSAPLRLSRCNRGRDEWSLSAAFHQPSEPRILMGTANDRRLNSRGDMRDTPARLLVRGLPDYGCI
jgi:hypothetical protein